MMDANLIISIAVGNITDQQIADELYEICDDVHARCDDDCPVHLLNGGVPDEKVSRSGCDCFKSGSAMLEFIRGRVNEEATVHEIIVGNVGNVYHGCDDVEASKAYEEYCKQSKENYGRASGESVVWLKDSEIYKEYSGTLEDEA